MDTKTLLADPAVLRTEKIVSEKGSLTIFVNSVQKKCAVRFVNTLRSNCTAVTLAVSLIYRGRALSSNFVFQCGDSFAPRILCARKIFAERLPKVAADFARRTFRLNEIFTALAFALGDEAGRRLAEKLGFLISADILLRRIRQSAARLSATPRVLRIDDFAFRKRHHYDTILINLETRATIDLLPDRESKTVSEWLTAHPGVEIVSRDCSMQYVEGITSGAPEAQQVADR